MPNQPNQIFDFCGRRVALTRTHPFDASVWIAQTIEEAGVASSQVYIGQAWLDEHTSVGIADGPIPADNQPVSAETDSTVGTGSRTNAQPAPAAAEQTPVVSTNNNSSETPAATEVPDELSSDSEDRPVPRRRRVSTRPACPACGEHYNGELGSQHACADILAVRCMHCHSFNPAHLDAPPRPPYLCPACVTAGAWVCRLCGSTRIARGRYFDICNDCNQLPAGSVWESLGGHARGNDMTLEVQSFRTYAVEIESFLMPNDAVVPRGHVAPGWQETSDGSIRQDPGATESREFRSPPLKGDEGLRLLREGTKKIRDMGFRANKTCGMHVHVGMVGSTLEDRKSVHKFGRWIQDDIYKLVAKSRSQSRFCEKIGQSMTNSDRYKWLNMEPAFERHGTVEFRLHHGTTQPDRIVEWVKVCLHIVESGLKMGRMRTRPTGSMMDLLGFTVYEKNYWTDVARSLHGQDVQFTAGS